MARIVFLVICFISKILVFAAFVPDSGKHYYIVQNAVQSSKVLGTTGYNEAVIQNAYDAKGQQFEFIAVAGKSDTYYLRNGLGLYLLNSFDIAALTEYSLNPDPGYSEWIIEGNNIRNFRLKSVTGSYLGTSDYNPGSYLLCDKSVADESGSFCLISVSSMIQEGLVDPDFENANIDGSPFGTWIPDKESIRFGSYGYTRVQGLNGWACAGNNAFYLRFLGDGSSYNSISHQIHNLIPGATYKLDLQYKCQSTSATSLVNIFAAKAPNDARSAAIGGVYATTKVAASNLASQIPQNISISFKANSNNVWIVFAKNTATTNYNFFIDNLKLTEIIPSKLISTKAENKLNAYVLDGKICVENPILNEELTLVEILNASGKIVYSKISRNITGSKRLITDFQPIPGVYFIRIKCATDFIKTSIVI